MSKSFIIIGLGRFGVSTARMLHRAWIEDFGGDDGDE